MSLLRQKLDIKPGLSDIIKGNTAIWKSLHEGLSKVVSELMQTVFEPGSIEVESGGLKSFLRKMPEHGLYFGYGGVEGQCRLLACFDSNIAAGIAAEALSMSETAAEEVYIPQMLDLLLFKPANEALDLEFKTIFDAILQTPTFQYGAMGQHLSVEPFEFPLDEEDWNEFTFTMKAVVNEAKKDIKNKGKPKEKKPLQFKILLPQELMLRVLRPYLANLDAGPFNANSPWGQHMRKSAETAIIPVYAVVETCRMTVADCTRFEIGQVIELPGVSLQAIGLETEMVEGNVNFGSAALGIYKSHRAVKLIEDISLEFS